MIAGTCTTCGAETWKTLRHPKTGQRLLLWPRPSSRYPIFATAEGHSVKGVGYCAACCPAVDAPGPATLTASVWADGHRTATLPIRLGAVESIETAHQRYTYWFTPAHRDFLRIWLRDHVDLDTVRAGLIEDTLTEWAIDAAEEKAAAVAERDDGHRHPDE